MTQPERREFAKQTVKWGGAALSLLTVLNLPSVVLGAGPGMGNPLNTIKENPFLQRNDLQDALKSLYVTYDSTSPYPHKFNDVISKGQLECLEFIVSKGLDKEYAAHYVATMTPILLRVKQMVEKEGPDKALQGMFEGTTCSYQLMERIDVKQGERSFPCPYKQALENCKKWLPNRFVLEWKDVCSKLCIPTWTGFAKVIGVNIAVQPGETCIVKLA
jgi:hypothetical protein